MPLTKSDIAQIVAQKAGLPKSRADSVVSLVFDSIQESLQMGERVSIVSFGTFDVRTNKGRMGRNPKTGETIYIPEKKSVKFKAGKGLKETVR